MELSTRYTTADIVLDGRDGAVIVVTELTV